MRRGNGCGGGSKLLVRLGVVVGVIAAQICGGKASASGPRFFTGTGMGLPPGYAEVWSGSQLQYFTDPGDLGPNVSHAQADAMVAAAAAMWTSPISSISLAQGGELGEHVSSANTYFDGSEVVFPADVQISNENAVPLPVIYDADGSVTDLVLGSGASEPVECRQNAVTESVDDIQWDGHIHHAMLILNGRCVGSTPEQLTQMQYQLARAFGRVLGLAWSQTNDNVFTGASPVTANQVAYWPLMHPLDVVCGPYTYQCMTNPFTLRADDLNGLGVVYNVNPGNLTAGKQLTAAGVVSMWGTLTFPSGQGMDWVNVVAHRQHGGVTEDWETVSGLTGFVYRQAVDGPASPAPAENVGTPDPSYEGYFNMAAVPVDTISNIFFTTEPIDPLYTGAYAIGAYIRPPVTPSGSSQTSTDWAALAGQYVGNMTAWDAPSTCSPSNDGSETAPAALDPSGWQNGLLCGWGHSSWWSATVKAGHTWTLEVTATDETGAATLNKAQPVVGIWNASDPAGSSPTLGSEAVPFNSMSYGMTQMQMGAAASDTALRFSVSDEYGAGRPDFTYSARMLYADAVSPASVGAQGGGITITGTGFRQGNMVEVNGVRATVQSWTPTQIVAVAPSMSLAGAQVGTPVSVAIVDASTGGSTTIQNELTYTSAPDLLEKVSAPAGLETQVTASVPFAVRVLASDGVTPMADDMVALAVTSGAADLGICGGAASCMVLTDSNGLVQTTVSGGGTGSVTLTATELSGGATVQVVVEDVNPVRAVSFAEAPIYVAAGAGGTWEAQIGATQDGVGAANVPVSWSVSTGLTVVQAASSTGANGSAALTVSSGDVAAGSVNTVTACVWGGVCTVWTVNGVDASQWQIAVASGAGQSVPADQQLGQFGLVVTDGAGHAVQGAPVQVYQRVLAWEGSCSDQARCAAAPVLSASEEDEISDPTGRITLTPAQLPGIPQVVQVAASTGTLGFVTLTLVKTP